MLSCIEEYEVTARDKEEAGDIALELADNLTHFWDIDAIKKGEEIKIEKDQD